MFVNQHEHECDRRRVDRVRWDKDSRPFKFRYLVLVTEGLKKSCGRNRERARAEIFEGVDDALFCLLFIHDPPSPTQSLDAGDLIEVGIIAEQRQSVLAHQGGDP